MTDLTAANASIALLIPPLFTNPQNLQQFAADDVFDYDEIESIETLMGVDGFLSMGWVWKPQPMTIHLQANSQSNSIFDVWHTQQAAGQIPYPASGVVKLPALGLKFICSVGGLTRYKLPGAKKMIQPRRYQITWETVIPMPG